MKPSGRQSIVQGAVILTASTLIVKFVGALFKIPLANILGGVGMSYFVSAYDVLIPIYSMTVTGLGVAVSRMVSQQGEGNGSAASILKTARVLYHRVGLGGSPVFRGCSPYRAHRQSVGGVIGLLYCAVGAVFLSFFGLPRVFSGSAEYASHRQKPDPRSLR